jgi:hypothetical protein
VQARRQAYLESARELHLRTQSRGGLPLVPHEGRVAHISLVFRDMWDGTAPSL